jgi:hypothetical protein
VRRCEARFNKATPAGRRVILQSLCLCGDKATLGQIDKWLDAEKDAAVRTELEKTRARLAAPDRQQARERMPGSPHEVDLLWPSSSSPASTNRYRRFWTCLTSQTGRATLPCAARQLGPCGPI